jgi:sec-independent protein translocase protein TatA
MFHNIGLSELLIILVIIILVFGVGKISKIGGELGAGIRAFKDGLSGKKKIEEETEKEPSENKTNDL